MKNRSARLFTLLLMLCLTIPAIAQHDDHEHGQHEMHAAGELELQRPETGKWASDASLRQGMSGIRDAFRTHHADYQAGEYDAQRAASLADAVEAKVNHMFANCRLPAEADAELHKLLAASLAAVRTLRESDQPHQGLHRLHRVLQAYPEYFEHPGWRE
jgi:hypothetical protein